MTTTSSVPPAVTVLLASVAATAVSLTTLVLWTNRNRKQQEWVPVGRVAKLQIMPVKSMRAITVDEIMCDVTGARLGPLVDREFVVIDADAGRLVTGRQFPRMVLIRVDVTETELQLGSANSENPNQKLIVDLIEVGKRRDVRRFGHHRNVQQEGLDCGDEAADWLRYELQTQDDLRLLRWQPDLYTERDVTPKPEWLLSKAPKRKDPLMYFDETPYMAMTSASLDDLNEKLRADGGPPLTLDRFRPTIQIENSLPFDEDRWRNMRIGSALFVCYRPCTRCVMTLIDPETGEKDDELRTLKALRSYRLAPGRLRRTFQESPVFGTHMGVDLVGRVRVGDVVYAQYRDNVH